MKFESVHSSIVMIGDEFVVGKFDVSAHEAELGKLDHSRTVVMPIFGNYAFEDSPFHIQVQTNKIQINYRQSDIFPDSLLDISQKAADALTGGSPENRIRAIGINLDLIVVAEELGMSGVEYCANHFLSAPDEWQEILSPDDDFSNAGRVTYNKDNIIYTIRFEPHYKSDKSKLFLDFNSHLAIEPEITHSDVLSNYNSVKSYICDVLEKVLAAK